MKIAVAIAGVLDPKWPIEFDDAGRPHLRAERLVMSPFDESALEIALRLRDIDPEATSISAIVASASNGEKIARAVAAFRIEDVTLATLPHEAACDAASIAGALAGAIDPDADLVLTGREFGDYDDGAVPPLLARLLERPFFGRVQEGKGGTLLREGATSEEAIALDRPLLCSVTNDRSNRLRKPLMKNVMAARSATFRTVTTNKDEVRRYERLSPVSDVRRPVACEMMTGTPREIAQRLIDHICGKVRA